LGRNTSAGQAALVPEQLSAMSHPLVASRQGVVAGANPSGGPALLVPSQFSTTSQAPALGRHGPVRFTSGGHVALLPVHVSAWSHMPAAGRQVAPWLPAGCVHAPAPLQTSRVQALGSSAQGELADSKVHVGEQQSPLTVLPSSHCSVPVTCPLPHTFVRVVVVLVDVGAWAAVSPGGT